ncbi:MAG: hypothetical protein LBQ66_04770 [Planctomycetaceae bacterium]|jgi:hypothetical protein|nr:hypothetical protein [Planctomycetaceae bacterium]
MRTIRVTIILLLVLLMIYQVLGCGRRVRRPADLPPLTPCVISVTFGGEVMDGVGVLLTPEDSSVNKWSAGGLTDSEGKAKMVTSSAFDGVVPGNYVISFRKLDKPVDMNAPPSLIPQKYITGISKETITITTDQSEYILTLDGLQK